MAHDSSEHRTLPERVTSLEDWRDGLEQDEAAKERKLAPVKTGVVGVGFTILLNGLIWIWHFFHSHKQ